jgi:hypothetical protein
MAKSDVVSRRGAFSRIALASVGLGSSLSTASAADNELVGLAAEFERAVAGIDSAQTAAEVFQAFDPMAALVNRVVELQSASLAGVCAKGRLVSWPTPILQRSIDERLVYSLLQDIRRICGLPTFT